MRNLWNRFSERLWKQVGFGEALQILGLILVLGLLFRFISVPDFLYLPHGVVAAGVLVAVGILMAISNRGPDNSNSSQDRR